MPAGGTSLHRKRDLFATDEQSYAHNRYESELGLLEEVVGYLNYSSGASDPKFLRNLNSLFRSIEGRTGAEVGAAGRALCLAQRSGRSIVEMHARVWRRRPGPRGGLACCTITCCRPIARFIATYLAPVGPRAVAAAVRRPRVRGHFVAGPPVERNGADRRRRARNAQRLPRLSAGRRARIRTADGAVRPRAGAADPAVHPRRRRRARASTRS